jgi:hypothetical protein
MAAVVAVLLLPAPGKRYSMIASVVTPLEAM